MNRAKTTAMLAAERHRDYREVVEELKALRQQFQLAVRDLPTAVPASTARDIDRGIESRERRARHVAAIRVDRVLELLMSVERFLALPQREWGSPKGREAIRRLRIDFAPFERQRQDSTEEPAIDSQPKEESNGQHHMGAEADSADL